MGGSRRPGRAPKDVLLRKGAAWGEVKAVEGEDRIVGFVISTANPDRDEDTISLNGWRLRHYSENPVVMWAHDYNELPIGRAVEVTRDFVRLMAKAEFTTPEVNAFGASVYEMLRAGFLRATSVGFRPIKWRHNAERGGTDFLEQELLAFSVVPVPANPEALTAAIKKGFPAAHVQRCFTPEELIHCDEAEVDRMIDTVMGARLAQFRAEEVEPAIGHAVMMATGRVY